MACSYLPNHLIEQEISFLEESVEHCHGEKNGVIFVEMSLIWIFTESIEFSNNKVV